MAYFEFEFTPGEFKRIPNGTVVYLGEKPRRPTSPAPAYVWIKRPCRILDPADRRDLARLGIPRQFGFQAKVVRREREWAPFVCMGICREVKADDGSTYYEALYKWPTTTRFLTPLRQIHPAISVP